MIGRVPHVKLLFMEISIKLFAFVVKQNMPPNNLFPTNIIGELVTNFAMNVIHGISKKIKHVSNVQMIFEKDIFKVQK
jgi:hypothetical protein